MPKIKPGESKNSFIERCVKYRQNEEKKNEKPDQSIAICHSMWRNAKKNSKQ